MPRRNLQYLVFVVFVSIVCFLRADSANRSHYEGMKETLFAALGKIQEHYLYKVDERQLFDGAMQGMVQKLDKNSAYMNREETRQFNQTIQQEFGGIGIEVAWDSKEGGLTVLSPIVGTPAYEAGIMAGDKIVKIENEPTKGMNLGDAVSRLQGKAGEKVSLTVVHAGETELVPFTIERARISVQSVLGDSRNPDDSWRFTLQADPSIGYIRISQFGTRTVEELQAALVECRKAGVKSLILDLRNNPGGLLTKATEICDMFLPGGVIVRTVYREGEMKDTYEATGKAEYPAIPLAILVNGHSASAAEIVSACLQDHKRAAIVGERTFGKGTVQSPFPLEDGKSILKLTIAEYKSPNNRNINRKDDAKDTDQWGVSPDPGLEVKLTPEARAAIAVRRRERDVVRRPKPKGDASGSGTPSAAPSSSAPSSSAPSSSAPSSSTATPTASPAAKSSASPAASATPTASPTSTGTSSEGKSSEGKSSDGKSSDGKPSETEEGANPNKPDDAEPVIPADDPQLRRAIEYLQGKPATVRAA